MFDFQPDERFLRMQRRNRAEKQSVAAANLQPQLLRAGQQRPPPALIFLRVPDPDRGGGLHPGLQIGTFSHTHRSVLLWIVSQLYYFIKKTGFRKDSPGKFSVNFRFFHFCTVSKCFCLYFRTNRHKKDTAKKRKM